MRWWHGPGTGWKCERVTTRRRFELRRLRFPLLAAALLLIAIAASYWYFQRTPTALHRRLGDGTELFYFSDSRIQPAASFPHPRSLALNGDAYLRVPAGTGPMTLTSRLFKLTIKGNAELRITAYARDSGEQVQVLCGVVVASKNYSSRFNEPDHLGRGEMSMVNQSIDLMEKETFDPAEVESWVDKLGAHTAYPACH